MGDRSDKHRFNCIERLLCQDSSYIAMSGVTDVSDVESERV